MITFECPKCKCQEFFLKKNGNQTGLYCKDCGKWIKWLSKDEIRVYENLLEEKHQVNNNNGIQCASCGFIGKDKEWFSIAIHNKVKSCPVCGTLRFVCESNRGYRRK